MHPPGSTWISSRTSMLGIGAAILSVFGILAVGLGVATYKVQDVRQRAAVANELRATLANVQDAVARSGVWPAEPPPGYSLMLPPLAEASGVSPNRIVLIQNRSGRPVTAADFAPSPADKPVRGEGVSKSGFTFGDATGRTASQVLGPSGGIGIAAALAGGEVLILQDETPVRDLRLFLSETTAATADRGRHLDTFALRTGR